MTTSALRIPTIELLREQKDDILRLAREHRASDDVRIFGSVARGDAGPRSDVDFLVKFAPEASLLDLVALEMALTELLGFSVDVMSLAARGYASDHARLQAVPL